MFVMLQIGPTRPSRRSTPIPIVVTPFYKPSHEDLRVQAAFRHGAGFHEGAQELHDTLKTMEMMAARPSSPSSSRSFFKSSSVYGF